MTKLSDELRKQIDCKVDIDYGRDVDGHEDIMKAKSICDKYHLGASLEHHKRYCCSDYLVLKVRDTLNLFEVEKFIDEIDLNVNIYYRKCSFTASYDNTYW